MKDLIVVGGPNGAGKTTFVRDFWEIYRRQADVWHMFYNSETKFTTVAFGQKKGVEVSEELVDEEFFSLFVQGMEGGHEQD